MPATIRAKDAFEYSLLTKWVESAGVGLCVLDADNTVTVLNRAACIFLELDPAVVVNRPVRNLFRLAVNAIAAQSWALTPTDKGEFLLEGKVGNRHRFIQMKKSWVRDPQHGNFQVLSFSDVTLLLEANRKLEQHRELEGQRRQWQALNAGVVIADARLPDMPIVYANPAFEQMSGYSSQEIVGKNCRFMQGTDARQSDLQAIRDAIKNQISGYAVLRNYRKDGSSFINELFISPLRNEAGDVTQFIGIQHVRAENFS